MISSNFFPKSLAVCLNRSASSCARSPSGPASLQTDTI